MIIYSGFSNGQLWFSIAMLVITRGYPVVQRERSKELAFGVSRNSQDIFPSWTTGSRPRSYKTCWSSRFCPRLPNLVMTNIAVENHHFFIFHGKIHYFHGNFPVLPDGMAQVSVTDIHIFTWAEAQRMDADGNSYGTHCVPLSRAVPRT